MDEGSKKPVMLVLVVVILAVAGGVTYWTQFRGGGGGQNVEATPVYLKCLSCGNSIETNSDELWNVLDRDKVEYSSEGVMLMPCPKCGKAAMVRGIKCEKCGEIFVPNYTDPRGHPDRCPKCGYSPSAAARSN